MSTKKTTKTIDLNRFSYFSAPITNNHPKCEISLDMVHSVITSNHFNEATKQLRFSNDKSEQAELKKTKLDYVTFSGVFKKRANDSLTNHSGLICLDIDDLKSVKRTKEKIIDTQPPSLLFTSPRGNGLKVVYKIDTNEANHIDYFKSLKELFSIELDIQIDDSCKDVSRACFLCHDPEAYLNNNAEVLDKSIIDTFYPMEHNQSNTVLGTDKIDRVVNWINKKQSFYEGNRNNFIKHLSAAFNRIGLPKYEAENYLLSYAEQGFDEKEITSIVDSIYKKTNWHNISKLSKEVKVAPTPLLPIDGFTEYLQGFINEYVRVYNQPRDYIAASVLFSTALAIGDKMELDTGKYRNIPLLWMTIVGNVSSGKSEPLNFCLDYFAKKDKESRKVYETLKELYEAEQEKPKKERKNDIKAPFQPQYIIKDYTPEELPNIHKANPRGLCIYNDELKSWLDNFSRYNKSGEQSTMLSLFYRADMVVNRVSKMHSINNPSIYVAGGLQIDLLKELAKDGRAENGFLARLAHVFPDGNKKLPHSTATLSKRSIEAFHRYLHSLASLRDPVGLTLSSEASAGYTKWYNKNADLSNATDLGYLKGVYGKLDVYALRFAVVLHGMHSAGQSHYPTQISGETMRHAVEITEYFRATALKVHKHIKRSDKEVSKSAVIKYLSSLGNSQKAIAKMLDVSQPYVSKIIKEQGYTIHR